MNLDYKITFSDTVFVQEVDGEMVLLDTDSENYFGLDEVGTSIWQVMQEKEMLKEVLEALMEEHEVEAEVLERDLSNFAGKLLESGLVEAREH